MNGTFACCDYKFLNKYKNLFAVWVLRDHFREHFLTKVKSLTKVIRNQGPCSTINSVISNEETNQYLSQKNRNKGR